jgi:hypothetical protein
MERIIVLLIAGLITGALVALIITSLTRVIATEWYETKKKVENKK